jgi:hypothetical protein
MLVDGTCARSSGQVMIVAATVDLVDFPVLGREMAPASTNAPAKSSSTSGKTDAIFASEKLVHQPASRLKNWGRPL